MPPPQRGAVSLSPSGSQSSTHESIDEALTKRLLRGRSAEARRSPGQSRGRDGKAAKADAGKFPGKRRVRGKKKKGKRKEKKEDEDESENDAVEDEEKMPEKESGRGRARGRGRGRGRVRSQGSSKRDQISPGRGTTSKDGHGKRVRERDRGPKPLADVDDEEDDGDDGVDGQSLSPSPQPRSRRISPGPGTTPTGGQGKRVGERPDRGQQDTEGDGTGWTKADGGSSGVQRGKWLEGKLFSPGGHSLGSLIWEVMGIRPAGGGLQCEVKLDDTESSGVANWWNDHATAEGEPLLHLCPCPVGRCSGSKSGNREVIHLDTYRMWDERPVKPWQPSTRRTPAPRPAGPKDLAAKMNELRARLQEHQGHRDRAERGREAARDRSRERGDRAPLRRPHAPEDQAIVAQQPAGRGYREDDEQEERQQARTPPRATRRRTPPRRSTAEQLMEKITGHREAVGDKDRGKDRKRRRESRSPSRPRERRRRRARSSSSSDEQARFREARCTHGNKARQVASRAPGQLLESCLHRMHEYLGDRQGTREANEVAAIFTPYLSSVLLPTFGPDASVRNTNELQNLACALDHLMRGDVARACDVLAQRFKAVELAAQEGSWSIARHVQIAGDARVSTLTQREKEAAMTQERHEARYRSSTGR